MMHHYKNRDLARNIKDFLIGRNKHIRIRIEDWKRKLADEINRGSGTRSSVERATRLQRATEGYLHRLECINELTMFIRDLDPLGRLPEIIDVRPYIMGSQDWRYPKIQDDNVVVEFRDPAPNIYVRKDGGVSISSIIIKDKNEINFINKWLEIKPSPEEEDPAVPVEKAWEDLSVIFLAAKMIRKIRVRDVCKAVESFAGKSIYLAHDFQRQRPVQCVKRKMFKKSFYGRNKKAANLRITFKDGETISLGVTPALQYYTDPKKRHVWAWNKGTSIVSHIVSLKYVAEI